MTHALLYTRDNGVKHQVHVFLISLCPVRLTGSIYPSGRDHAICQRHEYVKYFK